MWRFVCALAALGVASAEVVTPGQENMNGEYLFSATPGATPGLFPKKFSEYPGEIEYYDVYSPPITTYYSQVWWSPLAPAPFPDELVKKYAGKAMAVLGWEIDQVRKTPDGDVSVPINAQYNHHYVASMIGAGARYKKVMLSGPDDPNYEAVRKASHGMVALDQPHYIIEELEEPKIRGASSNTVCSSANGGEYRKSYHGFSPSHALVIESPQALQITPMQIDTWNRDEMNISGPLPPKFVPGPLPRASQAPDGAKYSGLLECPMTTRLTKVVNGAYLLENGGACEEPILTFQECFHAAAVTLGTGGQTFVNETGSDAARPRGCTVTVNSTAPLQINVFFNKLTTSTMNCASGAAILTGATSDLVDVSVTLNPANDLVSITLTGPADAWYGVGFGGQAMEDQPWTIIVDGMGAVTERKIGAPAPSSHVAGTQLAPSVKVVSSTTSGNLRTVVITRPVKGAGADYYSFNASATNPTIPFIAAIGTGPTLAYHKNKAPLHLTLLPAGASAAGACVCPQKPAAFGQATGELVYHAVPNQTVDTGTGSVGFRAQKCAPYPRTVLNEQRNPTCDIRHYTGGQWACHHMWSLLDADQEIPWTDQPLVVHHKWRLYVQPYNASFHTPLHYGFDTELTIGSPYEYDVPKCADGVPGCSFVNGTWIHTITGNRIGSDHFAAMNFHCHAPTCLSMAVYACDKSVAVEDCNATIGKLVCEQRPVYGGTGNPTLVGTRFDEAGYVAIPDCFWGPSKYGLAAPPDLTGFPLHMVKTANATWGHYGEMAGGQPFVY